MVGSVTNGSAMDLIEKAEPLPEDLIPAEIPPVESNGGDPAGDREIVLGRNVHTMCFAIKEPESDDEVTGEREAYMASVLARYRKSLVERTKHHLGKFGTPHPDLGSTNTTKYTGTCQNS